MESNLVLISGLWSGQTKAGVQKLTGTLTPTSQIIILPNKNKQRENQPDYLMYMAPYEKKQQQQEQPETKFQEIPF